jgi:ABC-type oligopeptide transport system substrate-binding subunit
MRPFLLVLLALAVALLAGCTQSSSSKDSSGKFRGQQRLVANAIEDFQSAASNGDQGKVCNDLLSRSLRARLSRGAGGCLATVDAALKDTDTFDLTVQAVRITGGKATARVQEDTGKGTRTVTLGLVKEGPGWKLAQLGS